MLTLTIFFLPEILIYLLHFFAQLNISFHLIIQLRRCNKHTELTFLVLILPVHKRCFFVFFFLCFFFLMFSCDLQQWLLHNLKRA